MLSLDNILGLSQYQVKFMAPLYDTKRMITTILQVEKYHVI